MTTVDYALIGDRIKQRRVYLGLTQGAIAKTVGITIVYLSKIENGHVSATLETLGKISKALDIDLGYVVSGCSCEGVTYGQEKVLDLFYSCAPEVRPTALKILRELSKIKPVQSKPQKPVSP